VLVIASSLPAVAVMIAPQPIPNRVATAEIIVVGKITAIEEKTVMAKRFPGDPNKTEHKIALIQVADNLKGPKGLTTIRLGFVPPPPPPPQPGQPVLFRKPFRGYTPAVGQEACFFLTKNVEGDFHVTTMYFDVVDKKTPNYDKDVALIKRCTKLLDNPTASLKSKDAEDRLITAAMLVIRYRTPAPGTQTPPKTEPIAADESKLILQALASSDWSQRQALTQLSPQMVIGRLNLTAKDGWMPPAFKDYVKEFPPYAQKWLKEHEGSYRIQRFVP
jgi:hypothetical protein